MTTDNADKDEASVEELQLSALIRMSGEQHFGVLDSEFLCRSLSVLQPPNPVCVDAKMPVLEVTKILNEKNIGSVLITDKTGRLAGIFTERDFVRKVLPMFDELKDRQVCDFMTVEPMTLKPDISIAFALSLLSQGGFRHIPLVDDEEHPIGVLSVRNFVDYLANAFYSDLINFPEV